MARNEPKKRLSQNKSQNEFADFSSVQRCALKSVAKVRSGVEGTGVRVHKHPSTAPISFANLCGKRQLPQIRQVCWPSGPCAVIDGLAHGDHMGGLAYVLKVNPHVKIYAPKQRSGVYGDDQPSSTWYRKETSQPAAQRY